MDVFLELAGRLRRARTFEAAADALIEAGKRTLLQALGAEPERRGKVRRGMVHIRPQGAYEAFAIKEFEPEGEREVVRLAPSTTAWEALGQQYDMVVYAVDREEGWGFSDDDDPQSLRCATEKTRAALYDRRATHLHAMPLVGRTGALVGMLSLETDLPHLTDVEGLGEETQGYLVGLCVMAAHYLESLPKAPPEGDWLDEHVPVARASSVGLLRQLLWLAGRNDPILLVGEQGLQVEALARWCHQRSPRKDGPFVVLQSALGATVDQLRDHWAAAAQGMLFIEHVAALSAPVQAALLDVLRNAPAHPAVRLAVSAGPSLEAQVAAGLFSADLYYRLHVMPLQIRPLRERADELPEWANGMAAACGVALTHEAIQRLLAFQWPGNLSQLDAVIRRAAHMALRDADSNTVDGALVDQALSMERLQVPRDLGPAHRFLDGVAAAWELAAARFEAGAPVSLDLFEGFTGLVLHEGVLRLGDRRKALAHLGAAGDPRHGNDGRTARQRLERGARLAEALGQISLAQRLRREGSPAEPGKSSPR